MFHNRLNCDDTEEYKALCEFNLLGLWCTSGHDWTSTIRSESLELTNHPLAAEKSNSTRDIVLLGVLLFLVLLGVTALTQAPVASTIPQENVQGTFGK